MKPPWLRWRQRAPGLLLAALLALAATGLSVHFGGPQLLYALLLGLSLNFLSKQARWRPGLDFTARTLLRAGVALLGLRITFNQVVALGWTTGLGVLLAVVSTIALGWFLAKRIGRPVHEGIISGAAVGICGASAALAVSSVLPQTRENERFTLLAVVGVTLLSTLAMVIYPLSLRWLDVAPLTSGVFIGATIHDVAQVVAAGVMLSSPGDSTVVDSATVVKLFRVMLLMPVVLVLSWLFRSAAGEPSEPGDSHEVTEQQVPIVPGFLLAFVVFMLMATSQWVPAAVAQWGGDCSRALLVMAIAAAGMKTRLQDLWRLGWVPVVMLLAETVWIALLVGVGLALSS